MAFGVRAIAEAAPFLVGELGGRLKDGGPGPGFTGGQWFFQDGERLELLEPLGEPDGFLHRFLASRGPGIHHCTFKVPDLAAAAERARGFGYEPVGYNDSFEYWKEAFLHPKQALGIVIQLAEVHPIPPELDTWSADWAAPPCPPPAEPPARIVGVRMTARSAEAARRQWGELLGGTLGEEDGRLVFAWADSPLRVSVRVDLARTDGPEAIEVRCRRGLAFPTGAVPALGARFEQIG